MHIHFNYQGTTYRAGLAKQPEGKITVLFNDDDLERQFGSSLPFYVKNKSVNFKISNRSHSELYVLSSTISKAISEQCKDLL